MDQPKLERLLRLMKMLTTNYNFSVDEIAEKLNLSARTVYRYLDTFKDAGFLIKKQNNCPRIDRSSPYFKDISELIHFTEEEAFILKSAIENIDENNLLKQNLKKKLYTVYDYKIMAETIVSGKNGRNVQHLVEAIENKKRVVLKNYSSANGKDIRDRELEAYAFTTNYVQIWCYCPDEKLNKLFKVSRIGSVEILPETWQYGEQHQKGYIDVFRISSNEIIPVKLKLGLRAASLLIEEYPLADMYLSKLSDNEWMFASDVCSYCGIGRFILGLMDDIEIIDTPTLHEYIATQLKKNQKKMAMT